MARHTALADGMYGWLLPGADSFIEWLGRRSRWVRFGAERVGVLRGLLLFVASVNADRIVLVRAEAGWRTLLLLRAALGRRRKLIALHFIRHPDGGRVWPIVDRWAVRRALAVAQVLTEWEREQYATFYGLPASRFRYVRWALRRQPAAELPPAPAEPLVLSAGRAFCDWETLFAAAQGRGWPLTIVCDASDLGRVQALNGSGIARVQSGVPADEFAALLARATVLVIAMDEAGVSQGHVRVMDANEAGVAVVATRTRSLEEYATDRETALLVEERDAIGLRAAVERLLNDGTERERLRRGAFERSQSWTGRNYLEATARLLDT